MQLLTDGGWAGGSEDLNELDVQDEVFIHMPGSSAGMPGTATG